MAEEVGKPVPGFELTPALRRQMLEMFLPGQPAEQSNNAGNQKPTTSVSYAIDPSHALFATAGMGMLAQAFEAPDKDQTRLMQQRGTSDALYGTYTAPAARGDYEMNSGMFRPDQHNPIQFRGNPQASYYGQPMMKEGGELQKYDVGGFLPEDIAMPVMGVDTVVGLSGKAPSLPMYDDTNRTYNEARATSDYTPNMNTSVNQTAITAYNYYLEKGLAPHIAAGIVGNLSHESAGMQTDIKEKGNTGNGRGLAQWDVRDRWKGLHEWAKNQNRDPYNLYTQLDYVLIEPGEGAKVLKAMEKTSTPEEASYVFGKTYERPLDKKNLPPSKNPARWDIRAGVANKLFTGKFAEGGEYELSDKEIESLIAQGYDIQYL